MNALPAPHQSDDSELLRQITAELPGMVFQFCLHADGRACFPYASEGIQTLLGMTADEVRTDAMPAFALVHPDDLDELWAAIKKSALTGRRWQQRFRLRHSAGQIRWLQGNATPRRTDQGDCFWHGFLTDVTPEVRAEEQLQLAASVFVNAQEGITITDAGGFITDVNPAFTRITGYSRDEVLGRSPKLLSSGHQDAAFYARMWDALRNSGAWRGEIWNRNKAGEVYPELLSVAVVKDVTGQVSHYISSFSDITHLKDREVHLDRLAHYDPLTSLPNRRLLDDRLRQAIAHTRRAGKIMAVAVFDLDHFKPINDEFGHAAGDMALVEVARRLRACVRENDTVARSGGDEFVLILQNLEWVEECDALLARILHDVTQPVDLGEGHRAQLSASIGLTLFPQDPVDPEKLLQHADQAMYQAKQAGRNRYQLFDAAHDRLVREHRRLIEDLALALEQGQFMLHYQPKVDMVAGRVMGVEALLRWRHPERGLLLPAEFLYAVMHSNIEIPLGEWVLETALQQASRWQADGLHLTVSINLAVGHLLHVDFPAQLAAALQRYPNVVPATIELEIIESSALADLDHAAVAIKACQTLGVRVALDDFGTGYSSLAYFKNLPVDVLKIDQTFIRDMNENAADLAIIEGVIKIAAAFGREVVAEGVETIEQGILLLHMGCRLAQGYAIARPMAAESLPHWLTSWSVEPSWQSMAGLDLQREDLLLVVAASLHRQWVGQLIACIEAEPGRLLPPSAQTCRLGRWLTGVGQQRHAHLDEFRHAASLHAELHELAAQILSLHRSDPLAARRRIDEICLLRDQVIDAVDVVLAILVVG